MAKELSCRLWRFIFYPESAPKWKEIIEDMGVPAFVSPLHDRDVNLQTGEVKKPHYHVLIEFDGPKRYSEVVDMIAPLGIKIAKKCNSRRRDERYWCHLDSPTKEIYDVADCLCFGGYKPKYLEDKELFDGIASIHELAERNGIIYYCDLANEVLTNSPELLATLLKYHAHFNYFCYSRERMAGKSDNKSYVKSRRKVGRYASDV